MSVVAIYGSEAGAVQRANSRTRRLAKLKTADVGLLPDEGHLIPGQTETMLEFLRR